MTPIEENWFRDLVGFLGVLWAVAVETVAAPYRYFRPKKSPWLHSRPIDPTEFMNTRLQEPWPSKMIFESTPGDTGRMRQQFEDRRVRYMANGATVVEIDRPTMDDIIREKLARKREPLDFYGDYLHQESPTMRQGREFHEKAAAHFAADVLRAADRQCEAEGRPTLGEVEVLPSQVLHPPHLPRRSVDSSVDAR